ncbi:mucin-binding protein [Lactobacillus amylovorus]|uniref:mucin-binding protein n=1 Tax=Lactobacillus amylovorus TaxID=1604 RepID=UPI003F8E08F2
MFNKEQLQRFSIRKLTVGAASVLIGVSLMTEMNNNKVYADVRTTNENSNSQVHDNSDGNTLNLSTDLKSKADEAGTADSEVTNNSNAKVGGDGVTDNSNARNVEIKNIDDSKKDQQSGDAVAPKEKTANTIQKHEENVAKGTTVDSNDLQVTKVQADLAATKINGKASSVVSPQIKQIQAKYQTSKNLPLEKQINPTDENSDGKVVVKAEDPSNYPRDLNNLIGEDKYIYQVLSFDNDPDTKLILSVNRNDSTDKNIYAYVDNNGKIEPVTTDGKIEPVTVGENQKEIIDINKRGYQINNDGSSNIIIGGNKESTQGSSTVTSAPGYWKSDFFGGHYYLYRNANPIEQSYGLGSTTSNDFSAIGEIIPIYTESSVIKYYYYDDNDDLQEFKDSDLSLHPNVVVTGLTGQEFKIPNVDQYKQVIPGFYLMSKDIPTNFAGTLSQFEEGKYYKKAYYNYDTDNVEYYSVYHQISPDGTMEVGVFDKNGNQITVSDENGNQITVSDENGNKRPKLVEIKAGHHITFEFQIQDQTHFLTVRNPYVTAAPHEVQFIYKKLGSIIPVDENGTRIGDPIQFKNNLNDPTKALPGIVPSISGYTPLYKHVGEKVYPNPTDPGENIEVVYRANAQTAKITYIDDTTKNNLDSKDANGKFGQAITFATAPTDEIANYKKQGYVLVSNSFNNNKYQADNSKNVFYVHLKHKTENVTRNDTVTRTIHYLYDNGNTAQPDKTQTVSFNETGTKDDVTGKTTWDNDNAQTVDSVITPSITGYTPDQLSVEKQAFKFGDKDVEVTVTYNANAQTATITYIDDTDKKTLGSDSQNGKFNQAITFEHDPAAKIASYEKQGYVLVSNSFNNNKYQADDNNNVFYVHLKHGTKKVSRNDDVNMTVHYVMDDDSKAPSDNKQTVNFTEDGIQDLVTQKITWTPADSQTLNDVVSPVLTGYTADIKTANGKVVNFDDPDINVTVHYSANAQTAKITYIDDTTKNTLDSKDASGKFGQAITFTTSPTDEIANYKKQGYVLVSNSFDNNKYQADDNNNVFYVHLKHGTKKVSRNDDVNMTVHYVMDDNSEAPSDNKQSLSFTENGIQDLVTKKIAWTPVDSQTFKDVVTPKMTGYTPDQDSVTGQTVNFGDNDINVTVHYSANAQTAKITYIDDTTKTNLDSKDASGKFGQAIAFATAPSDEIANYKKQGYVLVSNSFNNQTYAADNNNNVFYVHLEHKTESVTRNDTVTRTIHYLYDNGNTAQPDKTQTVSFNETGTKDDVTGETTWDNDNAQTVDSVITPSITGYTPDKSSIEKQSFKFGDQDVEVTVTYNANAQTATITYIDDTDKKTLGSDSQNGKFNQAITFEHDPAAKIASYEKQGYVLVSNSFDNNKYQADDNNNVFYVHLKHGTKKVSRNDDVNMTVHYVMDDDSVAPSDNKQTVNFTEDGIQDLVTQKITWTPAESQTLKDVDSPVLTGYTADIKTAKGKVVNFDDPDINVTVHYSANAQTAKITYIDDTTKTNLDSKDAKGKFGQAIAFATAPSDEIANYKKQGYVLVSNSFDNNKYQADDNNNVFYVHLKHDTKKVSRNDDVNMTVHYVMDDNSEAPSDNKQTVNFTEDGIQDLVTKKIAWTPVDSQTFKDVVTPKMTGYTPDQDSVTGQTVNFGDNDINVTVHYSANAQTAKITYIDDTTKTNLDSKDASGKFGQAIAFATAPSDEIANYKKQGYKLVSNDFNDNKYQADNNKNVFYVHFVHDTKTVNREHSASFTVHYIYKDGGQAKPDHEQTLSFTENGSQDLVTQKITWTPADSQKFDDVATPVITGYTPDHDKVIGQTANFETDNREVTVTYLPDVQLGHINYIDDNTGKTLTRDDFSGRTNEHEDYTPIDRIQEFENKGYVFVSSDYPDGGFNFDDNDQQEQVFNVHLKHGIVTVTSKKPQTPNMPIDPDPHSPKYPKDISNTNSDVKRTIDYKFKDGKTAQPTVNDSLHFERTVVIDKVTGDVLSDTWTPSQDFNDVQTPVIQGYTPDRTVVSDKNIGHDHQNIVEHVIYSPDAQHMTITYIDDTTHETLKQDKLDGTSDQDAKYTTNNNINHYTDLHYKMVSDSTNGQDLIFDHDDKANQTYEVHLVHGTHTINQTISPKQTVHYVYADDLARQGKAADDNVQQLSFKRDGYNDEVTGIDHWNAWTPANSQYKAVNSPVIQGYTPDKSVIEKSTVNPTDKDTEITVVYSPDAQHMTITYVDDTTHETLKQDKLDGTSDQDAKYTTSNSINHYTDLHYKMVSDSTNGQDLIFDHDDKADQTYEVHFVHGTHTINQTISPKQTVHYVYADDLARHGNAADDNVQQLSFKRDGYNDEVTGIDHWNAWTPANSQYKAVNSPVIQGYTPDKSVIEKSTVNPTDKDTEITVVYNADKQTAHVIYIDKTTNDTLTSNDLSGESDKDSGYNTKDTIGKYESQHYVLTGDETNGDNVIFDHDDKQDQTYYVYFVHGTQKVNRQDTVTSTIDYKFEDGKTAQPTVTQTKHFSEDGVKDLVTGKIVWDETESQKFDNIATKSIVGYTPDKDNVTGSTVNFGDSDIEVTVTYHNNAQKAVITYVDDVTKKTLASDSQDGKFDHEITFEHDPAEVINSLKEKGYKLVSNDFKDGTKYKADDKQNEFIVHLTHDKQKVNRQDQVVETIHYVYENGSKSQPDHEQTISFTEDGVKDKVTDQIDWTSATPQKFDDVATPTIVGYTPDKDNVTGSTVKFGDEDVEVTVTYHNNAQTATITYIDDTENKTLGSDKQNGKFNQAIIFEHDPAEVIKGLEEKGYKLVSDNFKPGIKYQNDNKFNIFEVHLVHTSEPVETSQTITETVHYIDANGKPVAPDHVAKVVIKVTGTRDKVTDSIIWNTPSTGHFDEVISPEVPNMTPDKKLIPGLDVQYGDSDITESVVYTPDNSTSKTPEKPDKPSKEVSKTPEKPDKPSKEVSKIPEKPNKSSKEVSKAPEKSIDSRTVDNHVSAKSTAKRELPQTGATTNTGIWTGLVSMIASLGLLGASKRRKKN